MADAEVTRKRKFRAVRISRNKKFGAVLVASRKKFGSKLRLQNEIVSGDEDLYPGDEDSDSGNKDSSGDKYSESAWHSSSEESEFEDMYVPMRLVLRNMPSDTTDADIQKFFEGTAQARVLKLCYQDDDRTLLNSLVDFDSLADTNAALKLSGESLLGHPVRISHADKGLMMLCVTGFNPQLSENEIKEQIVTKFQLCGKVLKIFIPMETVGLAYIYLDSRCIDDVDKQLNELDIFMGGIQIYFGKADMKLGVCRAKFVLSAIDEDESPVLEKLSDGDDRAYLKKEDQVYMTNLKKFLQTEWDLPANSGTIEMIFSWRTQRPDTIPEPVEQVFNDCWAVALSHGYFSSVNMSSLERQHLTHKMIIDGVEARYQLTGLGLNKMKHAIPFMKTYCKDMVIYHRPRSDSYEEYEAFEMFILSKLRNVGSLAVAIDLLPSQLYVYEGEGIYHPTVIDLIRRSHEKGLRHVLLLTGLGKEVYGGLSREFWELEESNGLDYGDDGGFIKLARHQCIIKLVIELKV